MTNQNHFTKDIQCHYFKYYKNINIPEKYKEVA